jgi:DnaK suppressor protein
VETTVARKRLEEMRDELDRTISVLQGEGTGPIAAYPQDAADAGASLSEADRTEAILSTARGQRDEVLAALARIESSTYGLCVDCGNPIPEGRLEARPDAARCVGCQAKYARRRR